MHDAVAGAAIGSRWTVQCTACGVGCRLMWGGDSCISMACCMLHPQLLCLLALCWGCVECCCRYQGAAAAALVIKKGVKQVGMVYEDSSYGYGESPAAPAPVMHPSLHLIACSSRQHRHAPQQLGGVGRRRAAGCVLTLHSCGACMHAHAGWCAVVGCCRSRLQLYCFLHPRRRPCVASGGVQEVPGGPAGSSGKDGGSKGLQDRPHPGGCGQHKQHHILHRCAWGCCWPADTDLCACVSAVMQDDSNIRAARPCSL